MLFTAIVALFGASAVYETQTIVVTATAPLIMATFTMFINITFTVDGTPLSEISGLTVESSTLGMRIIDLFVRNTPASLHGKALSCTAELSTNDVVSCTSVPLEVQGNATTHTEL